MPISRATESPESACRRGRRTDAEMSLDQAYALRKREEQKQAEAARKQKQEEVRRRRRLNKEIGAIVNQHRLNDPKAEVPRNFMYKGRIRKIHLTPEQLKALNEGKLGIAYLTGSYHLLDSEHVEAIRQISAEHIPDLGGESPTTKTTRSPTTSSGEGAVSGRKFQSVI